MTLLQVHLIWFVIFTKLQTVQPSSVYVFKEPSDWSELCPYTSLCGQNASSAFPFSEDYEPCCRPCSCDPDCGFHGDCCFSHLDILYSEKPPVICRSGFVTEPPTTDFRKAFSYRFRMINTCRNTLTGSNINETSCEKLSSDPLQAFYPVVSITSRFIYLSKLCALCNNVSDTVPWRPAVMCAPGEESLLSESVRAVMDRNTSASFGCYMYYIPPEGFDLYPSLSCSNVIYRTCSKLFWNQSSENRDLCDKFNATFVVQRYNMRFLYGNIYCFLCNTYIIERKISVTQNKHCFKVDDLKDLRQLSGSKLTVLLDTTNEKLSPVQAGVEKSFCPINSVLTTSFKENCRPVRCPWGQILLNNKCGYYGNTWIGVSFSVWLRLSLEKNTPLIPSSFFKDFPENLRNDKYARWIKRKSLRRWEFIVLYHLNRNKSAVDYLVVHATYRTVSVDPNNLNRLIKIALDETWYIHYLNSSFKVNVDFNEYLKYLSIYHATFIELGINTTEPVGYYPAWVACEGITVEQNLFKEFIYPLSSFEESDLLAGVLISKLFFCDQVDLSYDEYDLKCAHVLFRVKNTTIHTFSVTKPTGNDKTAKPGVRVCLHEFENKQSCAETFHFILLLYNLLYVTAYLFI